MLNTVDPVLQTQRTAETLSDPLIRALYFGTEGQPGFFNQLQQAGANLIGTDVPLQQTAQLDSLENLARQRATAGLDSFRPFFTQQQNLINQAIAQSRRAEELQNPYFAQAEDLIRGTVGEGNPYEDAVVQQTITDIMDQGDIRDIAARAQGIRSVGESAFGSRARLGAEERREALGRGLAEALAGIRSKGFTQSQADRRAAAQGLLGIGRQRAAGASGLGAQLAGYGGQLAGVGTTLDALGRGQRSELMGLGATSRGIQETGLGRQFAQQMGQQMRPLQTMQQIGSLLPGYQQTRTQIDSTYGMAPDPLAQGVGAAFNAYAALAPGQQRTTT